MSSLQYLQWTLPQYCCALLSAAIPRLRGSSGTSSCSTTSASSHITRDVGDEVLRNGVFELIHQVLRVLRESVAKDDDKEEMWRAVKSGSGSPAAIEMVCKKR